MSFQRRIIWNDRKPVLAGMEPVLKTHIFAVCAYGQSPYLEACLKSLMGQTVASEAILCTSTPSGYLENLAEKYGIPYYVREGDSDIQEDWNFAYHKANARIVTIAHQDDIYQKDYVKLLLEQLEKYPDMTLFTGDYIVIKDGKLQKTPRSEWVKRLLRLPLRLKSQSHKTLVKRSALMFGNSICCPSCAYRKELLGEPLFQSPYKFALDWDTLLTLAKYPGRFVCVERPLMYYRIHGEATTKQCIRDRRRESEEAEMFAKLWPAWVAKILMHFYKKAYHAYDE